MRAYHDEDRAFVDRRDPLPYDQAEQFALEALELFGVTDVAVRRGRGEGSAYHHRERAIRLGSNRPDWIVCHEVAHALTFGTVERGHGPMWARKYVQVVRVMLGDDPADALLLELKLGGVLPTGTCA